MKNTTRIGLQNALNKRHARINFAIFAAVAITIGWVGIALDEATGQPATNGLGTGLWFVAPLLAAIVLVRLRPDGAGTLGLTLRFRGRARWFALAATVYPVATALIVLPAIASGVGVFDASGSGGSSTLILAMVAVVPGMLLKNTIEELTWRGFGTRTAFATGMSRLGSHVLLGVVYGLWHLPLYARFMDRAEFGTVTSLSWPVFVPIFLAGMIVTTVILGEIRAPHWVDLAGRGHAHRHCSAQKWPSGAMLGPQLAGKLEESQGSEETRNRRSMTLSGQRPGCERASNGLETRCAGAMSRIVEPPATRGPPGVRIRSLVRGSRRFGGESLRSKFLGRCADSQFSSEFEQGTWKHRASVRGRRRDTSAASGLVMLSSIS
jgi:hypothetical protein